MEASDITDNSRMSYYAVSDNGEGGKARLNLTPRSLLTNNGLRTITGSNIDWGSSSGWYFDLIEQTSESGVVMDYGERVATESTINGEVLFFNTWVPDGSACSSGGTSWYMSLDMNTGKANKFAVFDAIGDDNVIDVNDEGYVGEATSGLLSKSVFTALDLPIETTEVGMIEGANGLQRSGVDGGDDERYYNSGSTNMAEGRLSWEELHRR